MGLFGKDEKKDPKEQVREWSRKLRQEQRALDRQIMAIAREENKTKAAIKDAARRGDRDACAVLAREVVRARRAVNKLHTSKAQLSSVDMHMKQQLAALRMAGAMQSSAEVMKSMQALVKVPEVAATMRELSREMMRAGIIEEMLEDAVATDEPDELEEAAQREVDKVLYELTAGQLGEAPDVPAGSVSVAAPAQPAAAAAAADDEDLSEMKARLEALRS